MKFIDQGYITNICKHGENSLILTVVTQNHGKTIGYVRGCLYKKNLSIYQLGNFIKIEAYSRVDNNMLSFKVELISPEMVNFIQSEQKLNALSSLCSLCNSCLPELENLENFYNRVDCFFKQIHEENWLVYYSLFEFYLLEYLGIGLELRECAVSKTTENLAYISPKTGRAVCEDVGRIYKEKLFSYPHFIMKNNHNPSKKELEETLNMTEFFLQKNFFAEHGLKFPQNRANLRENLGN